jgi:hypothetical protein
MSVKAVWRIGSAALGVSAAAIAPRWAAVQPEQRWLPKRVSSMVAVVLIALLQMECIANSLTYRRSNAYYRIYVFP